MIGKRLRQWIERAGAAGPYPRQGGLVVILPIGLPTSLARPARPNGAQPSDREGTI